MLARMGQMGHPMLTRKNVVNGESGLYLNICKGVLNCQERREKGHSTVHDVSSRLGKVLFFLELQ